MAAKGPAPRADARRNRARVLRAAEAAFAEEGILVPLDEIARRAGVGAGTVYRHFPTKEALFEEVVIGRLEQIVDEGRALAGADRPGEAFFGFLARTVERALFNHALCDALDIGQEGRFNVCGVDASFDAALGVLLDRAQHAGSVRGDVEVADVRTVLVGCMVMERRRPDSSGRMAGIVFDSLRPVTKPRSHRNETGDESREGCCEICGEPLRHARTGRPARYCGPRCRQRAHRRRAPGDRSR